MSYLCPKCGAEFDASLFVFGISFRCDCGEVVGPGHSTTAEPQGGGSRDPAGPEADGEDDLLATFISAVEKAGEREEEDLRTLQRAADRIAFLIVATEYPRVDIDIERRKLRELCGALFPHSMDLFEMIYEARFRRLWRQFRS